MALAGPSWSAPGLDLPRLGYAKRRWSRARRIISLGPKVVSKFSCRSGGNGSGFKPRSAESLEKLPVRQRLRVQRGLSHVCRCGWLCIAAGRPSPLSAASSFLGGPALQPSRCHGKPHSCALGQEVQAVHDAPAAPGIAWLQVHLGSIGATRVSTTAPCRSRPRLVASAGR